MANIYSMKLDPKDERCQKVHFTCAGSGIPLFVTFFSVIFATDKHIIRSIQNEMCKTLIINTI